MTERERLEEMIRQAKTELTFCTSDGEPVTKVKRSIVDISEVQDLADHLLANGVIVPPCKVGDTLYLPISDRVIAYEVSKIKYDGDLLKIVTHNKLSGMQRTIWSMDVGQTIFLSREDAEKALKERSEGK